MNYVDFEFKNKLTRLYYNTDKNSLSNVVNEVFIDECYKKGLDWIEKIKEPVVLDVGGFIGDTAIYFSQHKGVKIHVLEPCKRNLDCLVYNVESIPDIKVYSIGLGSCNRMENLDEGDNAGSGGESIYNTNNKSEEIKLMRIDYFFKEFSIKHIDLLKIDVEGAEYEIFGSQGFSRVNKNIDAIIGETHLSPALPIIAEKMLTHYGYKFEWLPFNNLHYGWHGKFGKWKKDFDVDIPTLFFAHR